MDGPQGFAKAREAVSGENIAGNEVPQRGVAVESGQGLIGEVSPVLLIQSLGGRIDGRQVIFGDHFFVFAHEPVFRMDHFETFRPAAHFAEADDVFAPGEPLLLTLIEIEKAPNINVSIGKYTDQDSHLSAKLTRSRYGRMLIIKAKIPTRKSFKECYADGTIRITHC